MTLFQRRLLPPLLMAFLLLLPCRPALALDDSLVCGQETARQEKLQAVPDHLLHAISLVESGHWDAERKANLAWPWTVDAEGEGRFLPSKQAAIAEVVRLHARGIRNIDVGCMQVNLLAHPDAFASLEDAFDPATNVAYAARFLVDLFAQDGSWQQAGAHYHSQTPELAAPYKAHLLTVWDAVRQQGGPHLQLASLDGAADLRLPLGVMAEFAVVQQASETHDIDSKPDPLGRTLQEKLAAKRSADAYRQAKLDAYRQKKGLAG